MRAYKITDTNDCTYHGFQWYEGKIHKTDGKGELCSSSFIHFYRDKRLAILLNSIYGNYHPFNMWLGEAGGTIKEDNGLKWGCTEFKMIKRVSIPKITLIQRVAFAILCSLEVCSEPMYVKWAEGWLQNKDRITEVAKAAEVAEVAEAAWAAAEAAEAAESAAKAAEVAEVAEAAWAAQAAAEAAESAAEAARVAWAARVVAWAARVAWAAARAAQIAAGEVEINLVRLATECLKY